jgi:hypothetical protein
LEELVGELSKRKRGDEQALDAIYLAVRRSYPGESEKKILVEHPPGRKTAARARELVGQLPRPRSFGGSWSR